MFVWSCMLLLELKMKDRKREAQEKRVKDLEEMRNKQQQEQERHKLGITHNLCNNHRGSSWRRYYHVVETALV